jgi:hypothetical protein
VARQPLITTTTNLLARSPSQKKNGLIRKVFSDDHRSICSHSLYLFTAATLKTANLPSIQTKKPKAQWFISKQKRKVTDVERRHAAFALI